MQNQGIPLHIIRAKLSAFVIILFTLQGCSGNGFHLRKNVDLPQQFDTVQLVNLPAENGFFTAFQEALEEAGGRVDENASTQLVFSKYQQGKRVIAYTSERKAREYLLFLKLEYSIIRPSGSTNKSLDKKTLTTTPKRRINIDRSYLYDPDFALGKAEEEKQVLKDLYQEGARLIMLRLQYFQ